MSTLAEDWDEWVELEINMMLTAVDWHNNVNGRQPINVGLLPFIPKHKVVDAVEAYMRTFIWGNQSDIDQWDWLLHRLTNGPIVRKANG
jgi:hypothetical protein